ncbi:hypothetical protein NHQ30_000310 [Ciborinia camelliae]|nr:hypothetical protein NHQ30_000310 [Ciborinia camelliae]
MASSVVVNPGPLVRLTGLTCSKLPPGGIATVVEDQTEEPWNSNNGTVTLNAFVTQVLRESIPIVENIDLSPWSKNRTFSKKRLCGVKVETYKYKRVMSNEKNETWYARKSLHTDSATKQTASWEEFTRHFKEQHYQSEMQWCKSVVNGRRAIRWDTTNLEAIFVGGQSWNNFSMEVVEMLYDFKSKGLTNRTFPVIQITASLNQVDEREFLVISIPLKDFNDARYTKYPESNKVIVAAYASIERIRVLSRGRIEWIMATTSDAKGLIPKWTQGLAVPIAIVKDVPMYMTWVEKSRNTPAPTDGAPTDGTPTDGTPAEDTSTGEIPSDEGLWRKLKRRFPQGRLVRRNN